MRTGCVTLANNHYKITSGAVSNPARPFRFGLGPAGLTAGTAGEWRQMARRFEDLGYHTICFGDHLDSRPAPGVAAVAVALWTTELRVAAHVYCNDFRHPGLLAKEVATVAMMTGGRFDAGIGAGWMKADYDRAGIPFDPPSERIERLRQAVRLVKDSWTEASVWTEGPAYRLSGFPGKRSLGGAPRPALVMGGGGRRMLTLAAQEADIVSINVKLASGLLGPDRGASATDASVRAKVATVKEAAGARLNDLVLQIEAHFVAVTDDRSGAYERAAETVGLHPEDARRSPHVLIGSVGEICEGLQRVREELGISYICMSGAHAEEFAPVVARLAGS
jgi:probable F420-dependent oxidoreductase